MSIPQSRLTLRSARAIARAHPLIGNYWTRNDSWVVCSWYGRFFLLPCGHTFRIVSTLPISYFTNERVNLCCMPRPQTIWYCREISKVIKIPQPRKKNQCLRHYTQKHSDKNTSSFGRNKRVCRALMSLQKAASNKKKPYESTSPIEHA